MRAHLRAGLAITAALAVAVPAVAQPNPSSATATVKTSKPQTIARNPGASKARTKGTIVRSKSNIRNN